MCNFMPKKFIPHCLKEKRLSNKNLREKKPRVTPELELLLFNLYTILLIFLPVRSYTTIQMI